MMNALVFNKDPKEAARDFEIALRYDSAAEECRGGNASALLLRVSEYLRRGKPVPTILAGIIATALEKTAKASCDREKVLAQGLGLAFVNARNKHHPAEVRGMVLHFISQSMTDTKAVNNAARELGVSPTTVWTTWRQYRKETIAHIGFLPWKKKA